VYVEYFKTRGNKSAEQRAALTFVFAPRHVYRKSSRCHSRVEALAGRQHAPRVVVLILNLRRGNKKSNHFLHIPRLATVRSIETSCQEMYFRVIYSF